MVPARGASAGSPSLPAASIPRCWPPAYGLSPSPNGRSTDPDAGQLQAPAGGASTSNARSKKPVVRSCGNTAARVGGRIRRCQYWLQTSRTFVCVPSQRTPIQSVTSRPCQPCDEICGLAAGYAGADQLGNGGDSC